jgi:hypothetical protein
MSSSLYRRVPPPVRVGVINPRRSYNRRVWGPMPVSSEVTEIP